MAKTDKEKKEIIADFVECQNYSEVARKYDMSVNGIKKIVLADEESTKLCKEKKKENTEEVLQEMKKRNQKKITLLDKIFDAMESKLDKIDMFTNIKDLATAYGIIMDKELKIRELDIKERELKQGINNTQAPILNINIQNNDKLKEAFYEQEEKE